MRLKRKLAEHVWYHVRTAINNREPVFQLLEAVVLLCRVLIEAKGKFPFEMRGLTIGNEWLSFYIKPADGYELPKIMQWMKQTFSCRFNVKTGRSGHVWGDRYKSVVLPGEAPPGGGRGGLGVGESDGPERDSGVHTLQAVMELSPVDGNRGKCRGFAQMRLFCLVPTG